MICIQQQILHSTKFKGGQCLSLNYYNILNDFSGNKTKKSYANYPKIKALNNFNKFQIPSTDIKSRAN